MRSSPDCFCTTAAQGGQETPCPPCIASALVILWTEYEERLSVSRITRRIQHITGHEAALGLEMCRRLPTKAIWNEDRRNGRGNGSRYVEHSPTGGRGVE